MFRPASLASRTRENWPLAVPILAAVAVWAVVTELPCASVRVPPLICVASRYLNTNRRSLSLEC